MRVAEALQRFVQTMEHGAGSPGAARGRVLLCKLIVKTCPQITVNGARAPRRRTRKPAVVADVPPPGFRSGRDNRPRPLIVSVTRAVPAGPRQRRRAARTNAAIDRKMAAVMMPAVTRPAGVVRSVALSRPRLPRRSFSAALISQDAPGHFRRGRRPARSVHASAAYPSGFYDRTWSVRVGFPPARVYGQSKARSDAIAASLKKHFRMTIRTLRGRHFGSAHRKPALSFSEVPISMLLTGGYGHGSFRFLTVIPFDDRL